MATKEYELAADKLPLVTSGRGKPLEFTTYVKGDKVTLDTQRGQELIEAGALVDPSSDSGEKPGADTKPPEGDGGPGYPDGDPTDQWTAKQLTAWSGDNNVELNGATSKKDVWAAVQTARAGS